MKRCYFVYIITNKYNNVLYTGVTGDLPSRIWQHKNKIFTKSFSAKYNLNKLVYVESYDYVCDAIFREKQIKAGSRKSKIILIKSLNPKWKDLSEEC